VKERMRIQEALSKKDMVGIGEMRKKGKNPSSSDGIGSSNNTAKGGSSKNNNANPFVKKQKIIFKAKPKLNESNPFSGITVYTVISSVFDCFLFFSNYCIL
jgi:hypothetical protein